MNQSLLKAVKSAKSPTVSKHVTVERSDLEKLEAVAKAEGVALPRLLSAIVKQAVQ
ncbi:hypothetical protein [Vibrio gallicus]|uniref:hypothetical protein n=1 Tax=Vibrio gallicus TaxID=190897 RepID=UPI0021C3BFB1|nr:hypothetical protein [Vibrio gallicus]